MRPAVCFFVAAASACAAPAKQVADPEPELIDEVESTADRGTLVGSVVDVVTDLPLSFADVSAFRESDGERVGEATTDQRGEYRIANLAPGSYRVAVVFSGLGAEARGVVLIAGKPTVLDLTVSSHRRAQAGELESRSASLTHLGVIEGVVLEGVRGNPLGGATVEVSSTKLVNPIFTIANEEGRFRVAGLTPDDYTVSVYYSLIDKGNVEIRRTGVVVNRGQATKLVLELDTEVRR